MTESLKFTVKSATDVVSDDDTVASAVTESFALTVTQNPILFLDVARNFIK